MPPEEFCVRVFDHPILGRPVDSPSVSFTLDGQPVEGRAGEPIAAALLAAGVGVFRYTRKRREPRGVFCAIGRCTDCMMTVDGTSNVRTCITPVREGMKVQTQHGYGPADEGAGQLSGVQKQ